MGQKTTYKSIKLTDAQFDIVQKINEHNAFFNIICCSRQFGKSTLLGQLMLNDGINNPHSKLLYTTPIHAQSRKMWGELNELLATTNIVKENNKSELTFKLINGSEFRLTGTENFDNLRGLAVNYMYCDEFQFYKNGAWENALRPMLTVKGKKVYIASTPRQKGSLFHSMFTKGILGEDRYYSIQKNYLDNPLANLQEVEDARKSLPDLIFRCEYMAEFIESGGEVFKFIDNAAVINNFRYPTRNERVFAGLDLARQHDFTVLTIMNDKGEVLDIYRDNKKYWDSIIYNIINRLKSYKVSKCFVESNSIGDVVIDMLNKSGGRGIIVPFTTTNNSKQDIIEKLIVAFERGLIKIPTKELCPILYSELTNFSYDYNPRSRIIKYGAPVGYHDDCVMSLSFAYKAKGEIGERTIPTFVGLTFGQDNNDINNFNF